MHYALFKENVVLTAYFIGGTSVCPVNTTAVAASATFVFRLPPPPLSLSTFLSYLPVEFIPLCLSAVADRRRDAFSLIPYSPTLPNLT